MPLHRQRHCRQRHSGNDSADGLTPRATTGARRGYRCTVRQSETNQHGVVSQVNAAHGTWAVCRTRHLIALNYGGGRAIMLCTMTAFVTAGLLLVPSLETIRPPLR